MSKPKVPPASKRVVAAIWWFIVLMYAREKTCILFTPESVFKSLRSVRPLSVVDRTFRASLTGRVPLREHVEGSPLH